MDYKNLSRTVSHALRHQPEAYGLKPDAEGWVSVQALLEGLARRFPEWAGLAESDLQDMIRVSAKRRHEMQGGSVRALYGHSTPVRVPKQAKRPPDLLYPEFRS